MNLDEVMQLSTMAAERAAATGETIARVSSALASTSWTGPDFLQAREAWDEHRASLAAAARFLNDLSASARTNADAQRAASNLP